MTTIKTLGDFRRLTKDLGDDFAIEFRVRRRVPEEELKNRRYPYPYDTEYFEGFEFDDVGYSDKRCVSGFAWESGNNSGTLFAIIKEKRQGYDTTFQHQHQLHF